MNTLALVGSFLLCLSMATALFSGVFFIIGTLRSYGNATLVAQRANVVTFALVSGAAALIVYAFVSNNYSLQYVYGYSSKTLPLFFKVTGLWAGLDGSLLLWTWLVSLYAFIVLKQNQVKNADWMPYINACMMLVIVFFLGLMLYFNNPFTPVPGNVVPQDGRGLNPLLQNIAMVVHPPMLYLGFTGFTVPFGFLVAALITRRLDNSWIEDTRRWTIVAWFFLGIGLILGGAWAYVELGWGGFWAWDPVENAGLLPWLLATAYIHSVLIQKKRGMLKIWNATLVILIFMLTIFGTYLTRSGIVQSVHAFGENKALGMAFLIFLAAIGTASFYLVYTRLEELKSDNTLKSYFSKESAFLFNNVALLISAFTVLWGTMFPTLSEWITGDRITVGQPFFNRIMAPVALVLIFLMGVGPMISWKSTTLRNLKSNLMWPFLGGIVGGVVIYFAGVTHWYVVGSMGLSVFVLLTIFLEFYRGVKVTKLQKNLETLPALFDLMAYSNRRFGGYIVHLGILFIFVGIAGSVYKSEADFSLLPGGEYSFRSYQFKYDSHHIDENEHRVSMTAHVSVFQDGKVLKILNPSKNFYFASEQPTTEAAIYQTPLLDVYMIIGNMDPKNGRTDFKVTLNPYISFMWIGGIVLLLGVVLVLMPRGFKRAKSQEQSLKSVVVLALAVLLSFYTSVVQAQETEGATMESESHSHTLPESERELPVNPPEGDARMSRLHKVAEGLICQCGGCVRESLRHCACDFAAKERREILAMMDGGKSDAEITQSYVDEYGLFVLTVPPEKGFFNVGYWMPLGSLIVSILLVTGLIFKWRGKNIAETPDKPVQPINMDDPAARQLAREFEEF